MSLLCAECAMRRRRLYFTLSANAECMLRRITKADELGPKEYKNQRREQRTRDWQEKPLHGRFLRCTEEVASSKTWEWLRRGELKKETEGLITAAQDQSLRTNVMKPRIEKSHVSPVCRMCNAAEETVFLHCQRMQSACSDGSQRQTRQVSQGDPLGFCVRSTVSRCNRSGTTMCRKR